MKGLSSHRLMVALHLLAFSIAFGMNAHAAEVKNLIRNGDFEEGLIEWELRVSGDAVAAMEVVEGEAAKGNSSVYINIDSVAGTSAWHLSLYQEGHELEEGKTYTLAFWGKAEEPRPVAIYVEQADDPWDEYGRLEVEVNEEWLEYWTTFPASAAGPVWPRIALGTSDVNIWVDNVRFYEGEYVEDPGMESAVGSTGRLPTTWAGMKKCNAAKFLP
jgi:hypothetical protein